jgi:hypothetical protein
MNLARQRLPLCGLAWLACAAAWLWTPAASSAAYLAVWLFWIGTMLGALANLWLHALTGGRWGDAIAPALRRHARALPLAALCFLPVLLSLHQLYPWAKSPHDIDWQGRLSAPAFKAIWLSPLFFTVRSVAYLALWCLLGAASRSPALRERRGFAAFALIAYAVTVSLAAVDWIMSLVPQWYSSVFGVLVAMAQMFSGMALAILLAGQSRQQAAPSTLHDLGNLLLMYVLMLAYLSFVQFLIIWAENLPAEISWYLPRAGDDWRWAAQSLALLLFALPLAVLLSVRAKRSAGAMRWLGAWLLLMLLCHACWLVLPSLPTPPHGWLPALLCPSLAIAATAWLIDGGVHPLAGEIAHG